MPPRGHIPWSAWQPASQTWRHQREIFFLPGSRSAKQKLEVSCWWTKEIGAASGARRKRKSGTHLNTLKEPTEDNGADDKSVEEPRFRDLKDLRKVIMKNEIIWGEEIVVKEDY